MRFLRGDGCGGKRLNVNRYILDNLADLSGRNDDLFQGFIGPRPIAAFGANRATEATTKVAAHTPKPLDIVRTLLSLMDKSSGS